jgi:hypothetical protein
MSQQYQQYQIPAYNWASLQAKVAWIAARAAGGGQ